MLLDTVRFHSLRCPINLHDPRWFLLSNHAFVTQQAYVEYIHFERICLVSVFSPISQHLCLLFGQNIEIFKI